MKGLVLSEADLLGDEWVGVGMQFGFGGGFVQRPRKRGGVWVGRSAHRPKLHHTGKTGDYPVFNSSLVSHFVAVGGEWGELKTRALDIAALDAADDGLVYRVGSILVKFVPRTHRINAVPERRVRGQKLAFVMIVAALYVAKISVVERPRRNTLRELHTPLSGHHPAASIEFSPVAAHNKATALDGAQFGFAVREKWVKMLVDW